MMRKYFIFCVLLCFTAISRANLVVECSTFNPISVTPQSSTGLEAVYVVYNANQTTITYTSETGSSDVHWMVYDHRGGGYAEDVSEVKKDGITTKITSPKSDCGYIIEDGSKRHYFWLIDYSKYVFSINGISFPSEQDCGTVTMDIDATCPTITYYSVTGTPKTLDREIVISYNTQEWDEENQVYNTVESQESVENLGSRQVLQAPLCDTQFLITGDKFLQQWGIGQTYMSDVFQANSIDLHTSATQQTRENSNEQSSDDGTLGGSAPVEIEFASHCTDAVVYKEWQISQSQDFSTIDYRYNEESLDYTFRDQGTFYVKFVGSNSDGSCSVEGDVYTISIGESVLDCPNVFSPNSSTGYNDEWKVSYKSIVDFKCWIFDRYGNLVCQFNDPSQGWDGKYKGKYVKAGVYYYVIEAKGADGKQYKKKGDINIINSTRTDTNETTE